MIPIRVKLNENEMNECVHCGREYEPGDTPVYCIDECPGYTRTGEPASWVIEGHITAVFEQAADGDVEGADVSAKAAIDLAKHCEYSHAHMENAMLLSELLCRHRYEDRLLDAVGGSAGLRDHLAAIAVEMERQFTAIGLQWDQDGDWHTLCQRMADAVIERPKVAPAELVKDVFGKELKIVFKPELVTPESEVRQTACKHCGQDIEAFSPYPAGQWRDRGNNTTCPAPVTDGRTHEPV